MIKECSKCKESKPIALFPRERRLKSGYSARCKECTNKDNRARWHGRGRDWKQSYSKSRNEYMRRWNKQHRKKLKKIVFEHYGNKCACCGETNTEFFAIDHVNGGGRQHRKKKDALFVRWIIKNGFPKEFRILCHNCNISLGLYGYCPHKNL